jgi:hypothetical protein
MGVFGCWQSQACQTFWPARFLVKNLVAHVLANTEKEGTLGNGDVTSKSMSYFLYLAKNQYANTLKMYISETVRLMCAILICVQHAYFLLIPNWIINLLAVLWTWPQCISRPKDSCLGLGHV